jgi:hypothetical protein
MVFPLPVYFPACWGGTPRWAVWFLGSIENAAADGKLRRVIDASSVKMAGSARLKPA